MKQYLDILKDTIENGVWVHNPRTKTNCLTTLNQQIKFDGKDFPIVTTRKVNWKGAINEMLCYMRGYTEKDQFHSLGVKTWDMNIDAWDKYKQSAGIIYGASAKVVGISYTDVLDMIRYKRYDRGIIWNFWNPEYFDKGCLRPCMYSHQFNVLDDVLHLTSTQRSSDLCLGTVFNMIQCWFLLNITAKLTDLKVGTVTLNMANCHIYENQLELAKEQVTREPKDKPIITGLPQVNFDDVMTGTVTDKLFINDYEYHPPIKYPFTV